MITRKDVYVESSNRSRYTSFRTKLSDFHRSEQWALGQCIGDNASILDIGCASGGLGNALSGIYKNIDYTGIDLDRHAIKNGKKLYPGLRLLHSAFPPSSVKLGQYDAVIMFGLFPHFINWKKALVDMCKYSRRYITFNGSFRLSGNTIADKDVSYFYYLDSGNRVPIVCHNIYQLVNYLFTEKIAAKAVKFFGYHIKDKSHIYYPMERSELIKGNIVIELLRKGERVKRVGGVPDGDPMLRGAFVPKVELIVDGNNIPYL